MAASYIYYVEVYCHNSELMFHNNAYTYSNKRSVTFHRAPHPSECKNRFGKYKFQRGKSSGRDVGRFVSRRAFFDRFFGLNVLIYQREKCTLLSLARDFPMKNRRCFPVSADLISAKGCGIISMGMVSDVDCCVYVEKIVSLLMSHLMLKGIKNVVLSLKYSDKREYSIGAYF